MTTKPDPTDDPSSMRVNIEKYIQDINNVCFNIDLMLNPDPEVDSLDINFLDLKFSNADQIVQEEIEKRKKKAKMRERKPLGLTHLKKKMTTLAKRTDNDMVVSAMRNLRSIRKESLQILEIAGDFDRFNETQIKELINSNCLLESWKVRKESSEYLYPLEPNLMCKEVVRSLYQNHHLKIRPTNDNILYISMVVYDSIKKIKLAEFICRTDNTFQEIADKIDCICSKLQKDINFQSFFFLEDYIVTGSE